MRQEIAFRVSFYEFFVHETDRNLVESRMDVSMDLTMEDVVKICGQGEADKDIFGNKLSLDFSEDSLKGRRRSSNIVTEL